jgi:hypothetical protein
MFLRAGAYKMKQYNDRLSTRPLSDLAEMEGLQRTVLTSPSTSALLSFEQSLGAIRIKTTENRERDGRLHCLPGLSRRRTGSPPLTRSSLKHFH